MTKFAALCLSLLMACAPVNAAALEPEPLDAGSQEPTVAHIMFEGYVTEESAAEFIASMDAAAQMKAVSILIEINSGGGAMGAGFKMSKAIERSEIPVTCVVDGEADSMAFYILQSCPIRLATPRSRLLAHKPVFFLGTNTPLSLRALKDLVANMETLAASANEHLCGRLINPKSCKANVMAGDWWMTAEAALKLGAVDQLVPSVKSVTDVLRAAAVQP